MGITVSAGETMSPIIDYRGKTAVVTGAATGVGAQLVQLLRAAGAETVIAVDIKDCRGPVDASIRADLSDPASVDAAVDQLPSLIHVLFNNAGVAATLPTPTVMGVNVFAPRRLIDGTRDRMAPGSAVVNTASAAGAGYPERLGKILELLAIDDWSAAAAWVDAHPELTTNPYGFSKECAQVLTLLYAPQLAGQGIRVNGVCPGLIDTPLIDDLAASQGTEILDWMTSQSGGRKAAPREIAYALAFLGSDAASYINGTNLAVDNGFAAAVLTNQIDYNSMPTVDNLMNSTG